MRIVSDGPIIKFVNNVYKIVYNPKAARKHVDQEVLYITERAVFKLENNGLRLVEIAPGVDLERDVISKMEFEPLIKGSIEEMDKRIFRMGRMGIKKEIMEAIRR